MLEQVGWALGAITNALANPLIAGGAVALPDWADQEFCQLERSAVAR